MAENYQGSCPICGLTLIIPEGNGNRLDCIAGHYSCSRLEFEKVWSGFYKFRTWDWNRERLNKLFNELRAINQVEISEEEEERLREQALKEPVEEA